MATSKTLSPTSQTISIPEMTDRPDASVFSTGMGKEADAINANYTAIGNKVIKCTTAVSIPASGSSVTKSISGLTADYELVAWNFSSSAENNPPVNLTWTTASGSFTIYNTGGTTSETIKPVFALPTGKTAT